MARRGGRPGTTGAGAASVTTGAEIGASDAFTSLAGRPGATGAGSLVAGALAASSLLRARRCGRPEGASPPPSGAGDIGAGGTGGVGVAPPPGAGPPSLRALNTLRADRHPSGITTSVRNVATSEPNSSDTAMPWKIGSDSRTIEPITSASAVIRIGRRRTRPAITIASRTLAPSATCDRANSTSRIELRTMMPASAMKPIIDVAVKSAPSSQ